MNRATLKADALLLLAGAIWGGAFVAQRSAMRHVGPLTFNGVRFALGALVLLPILYAQRSRISTSDAQQRRVYWLGGLAAGGVLFIGGTLQQVGLLYTTAGKAGFITGLYVVFVPVFGLLVRQYAARGTWLGVGLAAVGLYFLSVTGNFEMNPGDGLVLACAVVWGVHVLLIGWLAPQTDPLRLAAVQFVVMAVLSSAAAAWRERFDTQIWAAAPEIAYAGVLSVGVAYTLQVVGQRAAPAAHAGLLMSSEAVFAALSGAVLLDERLGPRELLGCALMLAGILVSQVRRRPRAIPLTRSVRAAGKTER